MEIACRIIIEQILDNKITSKKDLEKAKHKVCRDFKLDEFMSNSLILKYADSEEKKIVTKILMKKPTRTISGVAIVAVMCKPHKCPHGRCSYCPESDVAPPSYTGEEPAALRARMYNFDPYKQVYNRLSQLKSIGHNLDKVELIIMGGTFPSYFICYQEWFVSKCLEAMVDFGINEYDINISDDMGSIKKYGKNNFVLLDDIQRANETSKVRCVGMTFETRPDYCNAEEVDRMLTMGVTRVELGVQTIYNHIYHRVKRGHTIQDVIKSNRILRDSGIKVAMHFMPGLFSDFNKDLRMFKRIFKDSSFKPDMLKLYPCLITKGSELYGLWAKGEYNPYTDEEAVDLIVEIKKILPKWVRTMRIQRDIPSPLIEAGVKKSNLGELVYNRLNEEGIQCKCIRCREVGHQASKGITVNLSDIDLLEETYDSVGGKEIFLSQEDVANNVLAGFLRLRIPSKQTHRLEINENAALIRELHVYGSLIPIGEKQSNVGQHVGYGAELLSRAEEIAYERYAKDKMVIISGIGTRRYYSKWGYEREGPYMVKKLI